MEKALTVLKQIPFLLSLRRQGKKHLTPYGLATTIFFRKGNSMQTEQMIAEAKTIIARGGRPLNVDEEENGEEKRAIEDPSWLCKVCGKYNLFEHHMCIACNTQKPIAVAKKHAKIVKARAIAKEEKVAQEQRIIERKAAPTWLCKVCKRINPRKLKKCIDCGRWRPREDFGILGNTWKGNDATKIQIDVEMLVLKLKWGSGPCYAKLYMPIQNLRDIKVQRQRKELALMHSEDNKAMKLRKFEVAIKRRECRLMAYEDELAHTSKFEIDFIKNRQKEIDIALKESQREAPIILKMGWKQKELAQQASDIVEQMTIQAHQDRLNWKGKGVQAKEIGAFQRLWLRRKIFQKLKREFKRELERIAEAEIMEAWERKRVKITNDTIFGCVTDELVLDFMREIAKETLESSIAEREKLETETGIVFAIRNLHYVCYTTLLRSRYAVKSELESALGRWNKQGIGTYHTDMLEEFVETEDQRIKRERLEAERDREKKERKNMSIAEKEMKHYLRAQRKSELKERWAMQKEENFMREYNREMARLALISKYDVTALQEKTSRKRARRAQLKENVKERMHIIRETRLMAKEDEIAQYLRKMEIQEAQIEAMRAELEFAESDISDTEDEEAGSDVGEESDDDGEVISQIEKEKVLPDSMSLGKPLLVSSVKQYEYVLSEVSNNVKRCFRDLKKEKRNQQRRRKLGKKLAAWENLRFKKKKNQIDIAVKLKHSMRDAIILACKAEFKFYEATESSSYMKRQYENSLKDFRKMYALCKEQQKKEKRSINAMRLKEAEKKKSQTRLEKSKIWMEKAVPEEIRCKRVLDIVLKETQNMDTEVIHSNRQRFDTEKLLQELHWRYFDLLAHTIAIRAEMISNERRVMELNELLMENHNANVQRNHRLRNLRSKHRRNLLLRLRRSELGKRIFAKSQFNIIKLFFATWCAYWRNRSMPRKAFEMRHALLKHELDITRLQPEVHQQNHRRLNYISSDNENAMGPSSFALVSKPMDVVGTDLIMDTSHKVQENQLVKRKHSDIVDKQKNLITNRFNDPAVTQMWKHGNRSLICNNCKGTFMLSQNNSQACAYHPGKFRTSCPKFCPHLKRGKPDPSACMTHYKRRWSCCDSTEVSPFGIGGCSRRWHVPPPHDKEYDTQVRVLGAIETTFSKHIDSEKSKTSAIMTKVRRQHSHMAEKVAANLRADREIAERAKYLSLNAMD